MPVGPPCPEREEHQQEPDDRNRTDIGWRRTDEVSDVDQAEQTHERPPGDASDPIAGASEPDVNRNGGEEDRAFHRDRSSDRVPEAETDLRTAWVQREIGPVRHEVED